MIWGLVCNNMYWYEGHFGSFYRDPTILETVSIASQWVNTDWLKSALFLMKHNEREYYQHQCDSVKVKCEIRCNEYFFISFPTAWWSEVIPHTRYSNFVIRHHFSQFPFECKRNVKRHPSHSSRKTPQANADIAMRWFWAVPLSIFIFESCEVTQSC